MFWYFYRVQSTDRIYPLCFHVAPCNVHNLIYQPESVRDLCRTGCKNYNFAGGCPPRSPLLETFTTPDDPVWLICCQFYTDFIPEKVMNSSNIAFRWKFQDAILARLLNKVGFAITGLTGGSFLGTGYCLGCTGQKCCFKEGNEFCRHPQKRTYSLESTGINVAETVQTVFRLPLHWYSKEYPTIPYMLKCLAVLPPDDNTVHVEELLINLLDGFPSCAAQYNSEGYHRLIDTTHEHPSNLHRTNQTPLLQRPRRSP